MTYQAGEHIYDPSGNEWVITQVWEYEDHLCMALIGASGEVSGQMGGLKVPYEDGGTLMVTRK